MAAKIFEVGDILPAGQIKVSWDFTGYPIAGDDIFWIEGTNGFNVTIEEFGSQVVYISDEGIEGTIGYGFVNLSSSVTITQLTSDSKDYYEYIHGALFWEVVPSGYTITFEENGGSTVTDLTGQTTLPSPLPTTTKANHVFAGWYYDNLFTQKANAGDELTTNVTLYAKWYTPTTWCEDIADAIREKEGSSEPIKHVDFPDRIRALFGITGTYEA